MFFARILVILSSTQDQEAASFTVRRAIERAARPELLRFAVSEKCKAAFEKNMEQLIFFQGGLEDAAEWLNGETHFLLLGGKYDFCHGWDQQLQSTLQHLPTEKVLLTGCMERPYVVPPQPTKRKAARRRDLDTQSEKTQLFKVIRLEETNTADASGQVCLPSLRKTDEHGVFRIEPGLPLVCAAKPVRTLLLDPSLVFGPACFLQEGSLLEDSLSLSAFLQGYEIDVPVAAGLWPIGRQPTRKLRLPHQFLPGTTIARFIQLLGIGQETLSAKSTFGLFDVPNTYPQVLPARLRMRQRLRGRNTLPLFVSAFIDLPEAHRSAAYYLLRFGFLQKLNCLPLLLYTGGRQERALRATWPNTQSYPDRVVREQLPMVRDARSAFRRSKVLLMRMAAQRQPEFSHVAWLDMDILPHPLCPEAVPLLKPLMDEHIHMAVVDGTPDTSFMIVPASMLKRLEKDVLSITLLDEELKRGFSEEALWIRLYQKRPQDFVIHHMPARQLLFLSAFDREMRSAGLNRLLAGRNAEKQEAAK